MNQVVPFLLLVPVTSIVGGVLFLGETLTPWIIAGGILIMTAVAFIHWRQANPSSTGVRAQRRSTPEREQET